MKPPTNAQVREALQGSIKKWEEIWGDAEMTAQELYEEMKEAAVYFGVGFRGFGEIVVTRSGPFLRFTHKDREILLRLYEEDKPDDIRNQTRACPRR